MAESSAALSGQTQHGVPIGVGTLRKPGPLLLGLYMLQPSTPDLLVDGRENELPGWQ